MQPSLKTTEPLPVYLHCAIVHVMELNLMLSWWAPSHLLNEFNEGDLLEPIKHCWEKRWVLDAFDVEFHQLLHILFQPLHLSDTNIQLVRRPRE